MKRGSGVFAPPIEVASDRTYSLAMQNGRPEHRQATIKNVADRADVSVSTVSLVVNGRSGVGEERRQKIVSLLSEI